MDQMFLDYYSVAATALIVAAPVVGYRFAGPRLTVRASIASPNDVNRLFVEINNNDRSAITVDIVGVRLFYFYGDRPKEHFREIQITQGPELPARLEKNSFSIWEASADFLSTFGPLSDLDNRLWVVLKLGGRHRKRKFRVKVAEPIVVDNYGRPVTWPCSPFPRSPG
jgi:hypothetical protein